MPQAVVDYLNPFMVTMSPSCQKAQGISNWFHEHDSDFRGGLRQWPPQPPDLNPLGLRNAMKQEIHIVA